jgi:hypothetical protein
MLKSTPPAVSMRLQAVEKKRIADRRMPKNQQNGLFWIELLQRREAHLQENKTLIDRS